MEQQTDVSLPLPPSFPSFLFLSNHYTKFFKRGKCKGLQIYSIITFPGRSELQGLQDMVLGWLSDWDVPQHRVTLWASLCWEPELS